MDVPTSARYADAVTGYLDIAQTGALAPRVVPLHEKIVIGRASDGRLQQPASAARHAVTGPGAGSQVGDAFLGISEHTVSRRHALIRCQESTHFIEDLHSANGTYICGERLAPGASRALRDGDEVRLASARMVFHSLLETGRHERQPVITKSLDATEYTRVPGMQLRDIDVRRSSEARSELQASVKKLHAMAQVSIALGVVTDRATLIGKNHELHLRAVSAGRARLRPVSGTGKPTA